MVRHLNCVVIMLISWVPSALNMVRSFVNDQYYVSKAVSQIAEKTNKIILTVNFTADRCFAHVYYAGCYASLVVIVYCNI